MPYGGDVFPAQTAPVQRQVFAGMTVWAAILAKRLYANIFSTAARYLGKSKNQVRSAGFPKD
jgi:hypothetical protein